MSPRSQPRQSAHDAIAFDALVGVQIAAGFIERQVAEIFDRHGLTLEQYNVLRILRGAGPDGLPRYEVSNRLLRRAPDVTRLLDRLERRKLLERDRARDDRRLSITVISAAGIRLLDDIEPERLALQRTLATRFSLTELKELRRLMKRLRP